MISSTSLNISKTPTPTTDPYYILPVFHVLVRCSGEEYPARFPLDMLVLICDGDADGRRESDEAETDVGRPVPGPGPESSCASYPSKAFSVASMSTIMSVYSRRSQGHCDD